MEALAAAVAYAKSNLAAPTLRACESAPTSVPARAAWLTVWPSARTLAEVYWDRLAQEPRISADFRQLSAQSLEVPRVMPRRGAPVSAN
jgi:hypothetical protein